MSPMDYVIGDFYNCSIVEINSQFIKVVTEDSDSGVISVKDFAWNVLEKPSDKFFQGQEVTARYIGKYQEPEEFQKTLHFSLKDPDHKPYPEELYELSCDELLDRILPEGTPHEFIGETKYFYSENREFPLVFLKNIISSDSSANLVDPDYARNLQAVFTPIDIKKVRPNTFYQVKLGLQEKKKRIARQQLFQFYVEEFTRADNPYKALTDNVFKKQTSPSTNTSVANLLEEVGQNMYSSKERMFFELLQNADDSSSKEGVSVDVQMNDGMLIFMHNGLSLNRTDWESITSGAKSTRRLKKGKTGYKGIGFKSVFTNATEVYIQSSGFIFRFDKKYPMFSHFDEFYRYVNECESEEEYQRKVLSKFATEAKDFKGVQDIPWQLLPIWTDEMSHKFEGLEIRNMMIGIQMGAGVAEEYIDSIKKILNRPEFLLFMRNTRRLSFADLILSKQILSNGNIVLQSYNSGRPVQYFKKKDFCDIEINNAAFEREELPIEIREVTNNQGTKEKVFYDKRSGESMRNTIPDRIASAEYSTISFVARTFNKQIVPDSSKTQEYSSFFAYLPLNEKRFSLPFYVNADFVLTSDREKIQGENEWNQYLFANIGERLVLWVAGLAKSGNKDYMNLLPYELFDEKSSDTSKLACKFNRSYEKAIKAQAFILNSDNIVSKYEDILIDSSGLSAIIGENSFFKIFGTQKKLPSSQIDPKVLIKGLFSKIISTFDVADVVSSQNFVPEISMWLSSAGDGEKEEFVKWLVNNAEDCGEKLNELPLFTFDGKKISANGISKAWNLIATNAIYEPIKEVLNKIGIACSVETVEDFPLSKYLKLPSDSEYFDIIKKHLAEMSPQVIIEPREKVQLVLSLRQIEGIGDASIKDLPLFNTCIGDGVLRELKNLLPYREHIDDWLRPFVIAKEDNLPEISQFLVKAEDEFSDIVWPRLSELDIPYSELYKRYKWQDRTYTTKLINICNSDEELTGLLDIIEDSDKDAKIQFLNKIQLVNLSETETYDKNSFNSRILQLAIETLDEPSSFANKIFFNGACLADMDVKDDVLCEYYTNGEKFQPKLSLSAILPDYRNRTDSAETIKALFEYKHGLDRMFVARPKPLKDIFEELNSQLQISDRNLFIWDSETGNAVQFLFSVYYRKEKHYWTRQVFDSYSRTYTTKREYPEIPIIQLESIPQEFVNDLFDFLFENRIDISTSPFTISILSSVKDHFFNSLYLNKEERLLATIEKWADSLEKKSYLQVNGVKEADGNAIKVREFFLKNEPVDFLGDITNAEAFSALKFWFITQKFDQPYKDDNQKDVLENFINRNNSGISDNKDKQQLEEHSSEYENEHYLRWKSSDKPSLYCYPGAFPCYYEYEGKRILEYSEGDSWYDSDSKKIYVNSEKDIKSILLKLAFEGDCGLDQEDYERLCLEGTVNVSEDELNKLIKDKERFLQLLRRHNIDVNETISVSDSVSPIDSVSGKDLEVENKNLQDKLKRMRSILQDYESTNGLASSNPTTQQNKEIFEHIRQESEKYAYNLLVDSYGKNIVEWMNSCGETYNQYDFAVHQGERNIYIDCKGTKGDKKTFYMSSSEWSFFLKCINNGNTYQIYRVFNIDSEKYCIIIDDLEKWIKEEKIVPYLPATESILGGRVFLTLIKKSEELIR